jgi:hypothetical protein
VFRRTDRDRGIFVSEREERLDAAIRSFEEQAKQAAQLNDQISALRGDTCNADGSVTVSVAPSGSVLGLQLSPLAMRRSHTHCSRRS